MERIAALAEVIVYDMWIYSLVVQLVGLLSIRNRVVLFLNGFMSEGREKHREMLHECKASVCDVKCQLLYWFLQSFRKGYS